MFFIAFFFDSLEFCYHPVVDDIEFRIRDTADDFVGTGIGTVRMDDAFLSPLKVFWV